MNYFGSMVSQLKLTPMELTKQKKTVARVEYEVFCKEFMFDSLRELTFGQAFCKRFGIIDITIGRLSDDTAKFLIETVGYIKE